MTGAQKISEALIKREKEKKMLKRTALLDEFHAHIFGAKEIVEELQASLNLDPEHADCLGSIQLYLSGSMDEFEAVLDDMSGAKKREKVK